MKKKNNTNINFLLDMLAYLEKKWRPKRSLGLRAYIPFVIKRNKF